MFILNEDDITRFIDNEGGSKKNGFSQLRIVIKEREVYKCFGKSFVNSYMSNGKNELHQKLYIEYSHIESPVEFIINKIKINQEGWLFFLSTTQIDISKCFPEKTIQEKRKDIKRTKFFNNISDKLIKIDQNKIRLTGTFSERSGVGRQLGISGIVAQIKYPSFFQWLDPMTGVPYVEEDFIRRTQLHIFRKKTEQVQRYIILKVKKSEECWSIFLVDDIREEKM